MTALATGRRPIAWMPVIVGMVVTAIMVGTFGWWVSLKALEQQILETQAGFKKLTVSGGIPPNRHVMDYLTTRDAALAARYRHGVEAIAAPTPASAASADPQLYFQEQLHEMQRFLERLAAARAMAVPEQLGFPKELPPSDSVPRLLVQLALIREAADLIVEQGVTTLTSLKIEDPETLPEEGGTSPFLVRVPVRVRLMVSLPQLMKVLGAVQRAIPLIDLHGVRIAAPEPAESERLDAELVLARYLVLTPVREDPVADDDSRGAVKQPRASTMNGAGAKRPRTE